MRQNHFFYSWITLSSKSGMRMIVRTGPDILVILMITMVCAWVHYGLGTESSIFTADIFFTEDEVSMETAISWGDNALWLDARSTSDYEAGHIPGAIPLNMDDWKEHIATVREVHINKKKIVVYCYNARCDAAAKVAQRLRDELHPDNVVVMYGGWETWENDHQ